VDSQPKTQRSGREKTKYKHTVSNPNYSTGLGWKWGKKGESSPFYRETLSFPPMVARRPATGSRGRGHTSVRARGRAMHVHARPHGRAVTGPRGRTAASARTRFLPRPRVIPCPRVTMDAGGRPDGHFHPKTSVMTSLPA
jgi:hypothetical protein